MKNAECFIASDDIANYLDNARIKRINKDDTQQAENDVRIMKQRVAQKIERKEKRQ